MADYNVTINTPGYQTFTGGSGIPGPAGPVGPAGPPGPQGPPGSGTTAAGLNQQVQYNKAGVMAGSSFFTFDDSAQVINFSGKPGTPALNITGGWIQVTGGLTTQSTSLTAIHADAGGIAAKWLIADESLNFIAAPLDEASNPTQQGQARIYMNSTSNKLRVSVNQSNYIDLLGAAVAQGNNMNIQFNDNTVINGLDTLIFDKNLGQLKVTGKGTCAIDASNGWIQSSGGFEVDNQNNSKTAVQAPGGGMFAHWFTADDSIFFEGIVLDEPNNKSNLNEARMYMSSDPALKKMRISMNGGGYVDLVGGGTGSVAGQPGQIQFNTNFLPDASANLTFDKTNQLLVVKGIAGTAGLDVDPGWVQARGGFDAMDNPNDNAIKALSGGITVKNAVINNAMKYFAVAQPPLSTAGNTIVYMDSNGHMMVSQNGAPYVNLLATAAVSGQNMWVQFNTGGPGGAFDSSVNLQFDKTGQKLTVTGLNNTSPAISVSAGYVSSANGFQTADGRNNAIWATAGGVTAQQLVANISLFFSATGAPPLPSNTQSKIYMDSGTGKLMVSQAGAPYVPLITSSAVAGGSTQVQYNINSALAASPNFTFDPNNQVLSVTGFSGQAAINVITGYISASGGFNTSNQYWNAIQAPNGGGVYARSLKAGAYITVGSSYSTPPALTLGDVQFVDGCVYYDSYYNKFKGRVSGAFVDFLMSNSGAVLGVSGSAPILVNNNAGYVGIQIDPNPVFQSVNVSTLYLGGSAAASASGGWQFNNVCYASAFGIYGRYTGVSDVTYTFPLASGGNVTLHFVGGLLVN